MARLRDSWRTSLPVAQQPRNPQPESIAQSPYDTCFCGPRLGSEAGVQDETMPNPADVEPTPDDLLASAIRVIRETWTRIRKGPYGKQVVLQTIYQVYSEWSLDQKCQIGR